MPRATTREIRPGWSAAWPDHLHGVVEQAERVLDDYRGKIHALIVELDRADLRVQHELRIRVEPTSSAYWATRSHLADVRRDRRFSLDHLPTELETVMADPRLAGAWTEGSVPSSSHR